MGGYFQKLDRPAFNYKLYRLPRISYELRGPAIDPSSPYAVCIGDAQTFGRFCQEPYPALLAKRLGIQVLNLGIGGAGPRLFDTPAFHKVVNNAAFVVVQTLSAATESNSLFENTSVDTDVGTRLSDGKSMKLTELLEELIETGQGELLYKAI